VLYHTAQPASTLLRSMPHIGLQTPEFRLEYDFDYSKAIRGKYYKRILTEGANVVMLEPDVAKAFVDSAAVNDALRSLLVLTKTTQRLTKKSRGSEVAAF
jgi:hypothetical protein